MPSSWHCHAEMHAISSWVSLDGLGWVGQQSRMGRGLWWCTYALSGGIVGQAWLGRKGEDTRTRGEGGGGGVGQTSF